MFFLSFVHFLFFSFFFLPPFYFILFPFILVAEDHDQDDDSEVMPVVPAFGGGGYNNLEKKKVLKKTLIIKLDPDNLVWRAESAQRQQEEKRGKIPRGYVNRGPGGYFRFPQRYSDFQVVYPLTMTELDEALTAALKEDRFESEAR